MTDTKTQKAGRPRSVETHKAILDAAALLMDEIPLRDITIAGIAKKSGVGRPTIYRWWNSKYELLMDAFLITSTPKIPCYKDKTTNEAIRENLVSVIKLLSGRSGRVVAEMIGEGQSDSRTLEEFRKRFFSRLLEHAEKIIERGKESGELDKSLSTKVALDTMYGPIFYRLIINHEPLDQAFCDSQPDVVINILNKIS